jgi:hypothetical protein
MNSVVVGLISFACLFGGALLGMWLRTRLPGHHLNEDSQRIVNLGAGIIGTMAAHVLGLLVASARGNFDAQSNELTTMAAKLVLLDHGLVLYGPDAQASRDLLRYVVLSMIEQLWPNEQQPPRKPSDAEETAPRELYEAIQKLSPQNEIQPVKSQAVGILTDIVEQRWLIVEQKGRSVSRPLLVILVFSLSINFLSFGLFAPRNATVLATLCLCAMAAAGAIFLTLEFYHPFGGLIQIPSAILRNALTQMGS